LHKQHRTNANVNAVSALENDQRGQEQDNEKRDGNNSSYATVF
jgi:hypothetical protein